MIHTPTVRPRQYRWLTAAAPILGRRVYIPGRRVTVAGEGVIITTMATISGPHRIEAVHLRIGQTPKSTVSLDVLISDNPSTLIDAQITDEHLSGLQGLNEGLAGSTNDARFPINRLNTRPLTYYKLLTYNADIANLDMFAFLEIIMLGTR